MRVNFPVFDRETTSIREGEWLCSKTNAKGIITHVNQVFCRVSGYDEFEMLGQSHNIVRHPDMPRIVFSWCWDTLMQGKAWSAVVKNRCKNGDAYWVDLQITPEMNEANTVVAYLAVHQKACQEQVEQAEALYQNFREAEGELAKRMQLSESQVYHLYKSHLHSSLCKQSNLSNIAGA